MVQFASYLRRVLFFKSCQINLSLKPFHLELAPLLKLKSVCIGLLYSQINIKYGLKLLQNTDLSKAKFRRNVTQSLGGGGGEEGYSLLMA